MLSDSLARVCALQPHYSSSNTDEMQERGRLIRQVIPDELRAMETDLRAALGRFSPQFGVDASDGIGRKTQAPWVRIHDRDMSPTPRDGYYVVIHFTADGSAMFITVGCGSTVWADGALKSAPEEELRRRTDWAREIIVEAFGSLVPFDDRIALGARAALPRTFENATVMAKRLPVSEITDAAARALLVEATRRLAAIYEVQSRSMGQADAIRLHALRRYVEPAREEGQSRVSIRAGDVHAEMGLTNALPNVCSALRGSKFAALAGVSLLDRAGPENSNTTTFEFDLRPVSEDAEQQQPRAPTVVTEPTNLILHGPPGTGKTHATAAEAVRLCDGLSRDDSLLSPERRGDLMARFAKLREEERIEFVTFHQSYGYEDFVEALRPVQAAQEGQAAIGFSLEPRPGVFKAICRRAEASKGSGAAAFKLGDRRVFKMSLGAVADADEEYLFEEAIETERVLLGWGDKVDWSDARFADRREMIEAWRPFNPEGRPLSGSSGSIKYPYTLRNRVREGDLIVVSKGNSLFRAIGEVTGPYEHRPREEDEYANQRRVKWLWIDRRGVPVDEIYSSGFAMGSLYELNREQIKEPGLARYLSAATPAAGPPEAFVLIIDEINRANISKVFGELITLIEPGRRLSTSERPNLEALEVQLPFSHERFGVPPNLHIVGTMNTADRSIALLDTALRRRFRFRELLPNPEILSTDVEGVDVRALLTRLNERIEYLFDRDHQIGHAYFLAATTREQLDEVMREAVIPLLVEYFHEDWERVWAVLAEPANRDEGSFLSRRKLSLGGPDHDGDDRHRYAVKPRFDEDAYTRLTS